MLAIGHVQVLKLEQRAAEVSLRRHISSWLQPATTDPSQSTAHLISQPSGASGITYLRKASTLYGSEEWGTRREEQPWQQRSEEGEEQRFSCSLWKDCDGAGIHTAVQDLMPEQEDISWRTVSHGWYPMTEQGKRMRRKGQYKGKITG